MLWRIVLVGILCLIPLMFLAWCILNVGDQYSENEENSDLVQLDKI